MTSLFIARDVKMPCRKIRLIIHPTYIEIVYDNILWRGGKRRRDYISLFKILQWGISDKHDDTFFISFYPQNLYKKPVHESIFKDDYPVPVHLLLFDFNNDGSTINEIDICIKTAIQNIQQQLRLPISPFHKGNQLDKDVYVFFC